jgi:hypothetical protein
MLLGARARHPDCALSLGEEMSMDWAMSYGWADPGSGASG